MMALALALFSSPAIAASVLIWPIDPVVTADRNGTELWLENRGASDVVLQIRVMRWTQVGGKDRYAEQAEVLASPPMVRIAPKVRQLVRLVLPDKGPREGEDAYRIIVDEIPAVTEAGKPDDTVRIRFRMRYSIPLFVYGKGFDTKKRIPVPDVEALSCTIAANRHSVFIGNVGRVHARLTDIVLENGASTVSVSAGLFGYVLPGSKMNWPLPDGAGAGGTLKARINGSQKQVTLGACSPE
jgi:fimbrial chaperone protein